MYINISYINVEIEQKQRMKKGMRERVSGDDVCDCSFGELPDNKKQRVLPFFPLLVCSSISYDFFVLRVKAFKSTDSTFLYVCSTSIH